MGRRLAVRCGQGRSASDEHHAIASGVTAGSEIGHEPPGIEVEARDEGRADSDERIAIGVRARDGEDQSCRADVTRLRLGRTDLRLEIGEASDDLNRDTDAAGGEKDVDRSKITGDRERSLQRDLPGSTDARNEGRDVSRLGGVANTAANRPELDRDLEPHAGRVDGQLRPGQAAGPTELAARDLRLRDADDGSECRLGDPEDVAAGAQLVADLMGEAIPQSPGFIESARPGCHLVMVMTAAYRPRTTGLFRGWGCMRQEMAEYARGGRGSDAAVANVAVQACAWVHRLRGGRYTPSVGTQDRQAWKRLSRMIG